MLLKRLLIMIRLINMALVNIEFGPTLWERVVDVSIDLPSFTLETREKTRRLTVAPNLWP